MEERLAMINEGKNDLERLWIKFIQDTNQRITELENTLIIEKACLDMAKAKLTTL